MSERMSDEPVLLSRDQWKSLCKRAEAAEAKLEAVRGLQRYRVEPLNPEFYERGAASFTRDPNGNAVMHSELQALISQEQ